jgi:hypothetical protein
MRVRAAVPEMPALPRTLHQGVFIRASSAARNSLSALHCGRSALSAMRRPTA